jgi:hypothetical protein
MNKPDDKDAIRELIENWVVWRDMGEWDLLRTIWHPGGRMSASWREGTADEFIAANRKSWDTGLDILHQLGGSSITVKDGRAVSITKMVISQRSIIHDVLCDVSAQARHYDLWEKLDGRWGLWERRTIFDRDRIDAVVPGEVVKLDPEKLKSFPVNYRHLAYLQSNMGFPVRPDLPRLRDPNTQRLYDYGQKWLDTGARGDFV